MIPLHYFILSSLFKHPILAPNPFSPPMYPLHRSRPWVYIQKTCTWCLFFTETSSRSARSSSRYKAQMPRRDGRIAHMPLYGFFVAAFLPRGRQPCSDTRKKTKEIKKRSDHVDLCSSYRLSCLLWMFLFPFPFTFLSSRMPLWVVRKFFPFNIAGRPGPSLGPWSFFSFSLPGGYLASALEGFRPSPPLPLFLYLALFLC